MNARFAILADDLTGGADTGAAFAAAGLRTVVLLSPKAPIPPDADVLVMTSESRALPPSQADEATGRCTRRIAEWCGSDETARVYVKIDSTLRGHPARTLRAVMEALGAARALVAPAFPSQERTTRQGRQYVQGVPLEDTPFGREVETSDLVALFEHAAPGRVSLLSRADPPRRGADVLAQGDGVCIADAEDDDDLAVLASAAAASPLRILCGSAGLARAIARDLSRGEPTVRSDHERRRPADEGRPPVLVLAGSRHVATVAQVKALETRGALVIAPDASYLESGAAEGAARTAAQVGDALASGRVVVLATTGLAEVSAARLDVAARLAAIVGTVRARAPIGGLVLTGGDTAAAVCAALGATSLWLTGELQPGIATATLIGGRRSGLAIVTKAGGFGDDGALVDAVACLTAGVRATS